MAPNKRLVAVLFAFVSAAKADILYVDSFRNIEYTQTGNGAPASPTGYFYSSDLNASVPNSWTSVNMSFPGPASPVSLTQQSAYVYHYQTGFYSTLSALNAAFPAGTYSFSAVNGSTAGAASFVYSGDDFPQSVPYLTGAGYSSLQGLNAANPFTFNFDTFATGPAANDSYVNFTIFDNTTGAFAVNATLLPATTLGINIAANTLRPGDSYTYDLDFSNRDFYGGPIMTSAPLSGPVQIQSATNPAQLGFDVRTDGTFTTAAVPEPCTALLAGFAMLAAAAKRGLKARPGK